VTDPAPEPVLPLNDDGSWLKGLKSDVQPTTFLNGRQYAEARRVSMLSRTEVGISARVTGADGAKFDVQVAPTGAGTIESLCNCESWNKEGQHCRHVVAAALIYLARVKARADSEAIVLADERQAEPVALPALAKLENWLGLSTMPDLEFQYRLSPAQAPTGGRIWIVDVRRVDQQAKGPVQVKRILSMGARVAPADERVLAELAKHEVRFDSKVVLKDEELTELLDLLRARKVVYRGTALLFASEPARPTIRLQQTPEGANARIEIALPGGAALALKDVIVLSGRRTWVIAGQSAHLLEPDFPPRMLRKWMLEPMMSFPPAQLDRALSFFAAHLPRYRLALQADGIDVDDPDRAFASYSLSRAAPTT
jgi:hypothetical protein